MFRNPKPFLVQEYYFFETWTYRAAAAAATATRYQHLDTMPLQDVEFGCFCGPSRTVLLGGWTKVWRNAPPQEPDQDAHQHEERRHVEAAHQPARAVVDPERLPVKAPPKSLIRAKAPPPEEPCDRRRDQSLWV